MPTLLHLHLIEQEVQVVVQVMVVVVRQVEQVIHHLLVHHKEIVVVMLDQVEIQDYQQEVVEQVQ